MVRYPKRLDRPKDEVIADRLSRKQERAARKATRPPKPPKSKRVVQSCDAHTCAINVMAPLKRKACYEVKEPNFSMRLVKTNHFDRIHVDVKQPTRLYLDWFWNHLRASRAPQILMEVFPNSKEITESCASLFAARKVPIDLSNVEVVVVGDGSTPRTGALFAPFVKQVTSVDPLLNPQKWSAPMRSNATWCPQTIQAWIADQKANDSATLIVAVHAHVSPSDYVPALIQVRDVVGLVTIECCVPQICDFGTLLHSYQDWGIHSPCRSVRVYNALRPPK